MKIGITWTKNYGLFKLSDHNRDIDLTGAKRKQLRKSMERYGYIGQYPILCHREHGQLIVDDGQHRLAIAKELGLAVAYSVCETQIDTPFVNNTQKTWAVMDYAKSFAKQGKDDYVELLEFSERHGFPLSICLNVLAGTSGSKGNADAASTSVAARFRRGEFKITNRKNADRVAHIYAALRQIEPACCDRFMLSAIAAYTLVPKLDDSRLLSNAKRTPERLRKLGSRDGYLELLETIYNFGRSQMVPVKVPAENIIRSRNCATRGKADVVEPAAAARTV